ncbi:MAG: hypothetical protein JWM39_614 [Parcubacteria group bacterium]|nr:hypothetical protein [Parcubacteria group bacterium]
MDWSSLPGIKTIENIHGYAASHGRFVDWKPIAYTFAGLNIIFLIIAPVQTFRNYEFLLFFAPLWLPIVLVQAATLRKLQANREDFLLKQKYVLLEMRLPRDTMKTPLAMETFFSNMHFGPGESTTYKIKAGAMRPWWSFEIASIEGRVHFFIWTREMQRRGIESYLYSQYPDMEIIEAEDYSRIFDPSDFSKNSMFGEEFKKVHANKDAKADPYPIKTYVDYGLDKAGTKPEEQIDPLAQVIELLGSIGPKEQFWIQFIIRQSKAEKHGEDWKKVGAAEVEKIRAATVKKTTRVDPVTGNTIETSGFPNPTKGQQETINAIERNTNKAGFDVGIRMIYSAPKDAYQGGMIAFFMSLFKPFTNENGAGFAPVQQYSAAFNDYPWEDPKGYAHRAVEKKVVDLYRQRAYFNQPYNGPWSIMSTEELATLFHVPSSTVQTPALPRMQSSTSGAPSNLPI